MIKVFDDKNYQADWEKYKRNSARAIIFCDAKLVMVKSDKYGEYKFPGGGIEGDETHTETLLRETKEETGLHIIPESIKEYGKTLVVRKNFEQDKIFEQESFYYLCDIDTDKQSPPRPEEGYEKEYGYKLVYVTLEEAISANEKLVNIPAIPWVKRDLAVLCELLVKRMEDKWI